MKKEKMEFSNKEILNIITNISKSFNDNRYLPAKINFIIQKNVSIFMNLYNEIFDEQRKILEHYGTMTAEDTFNIDAAVRETAQKELDDLLNIRQEVEFYTIGIDFLDNIEFTQNQMSSILFMIKE